MQAHVLVLQCLVVEHLLPPLGRRIEDHALAEDRRHERVGLGLVQLLFGRAEESLVRRGTGKQNDTPIAQNELADVAAFFADAPHQRDRIVAKLLEVAACRVRAGNLRWLLELGRDGHRSPSIGASG